MPSYRALGFSVRLHVWDAQQQPPPLDDRLLALDPSVGNALEEVSEEYFDGQQGLQWLGDAPFYLVNAGRDLLLRQSQSLDDCEDIEGPDHKSHQQSSVDKNASPAPYTPSKPQSTAGLLLNDSPSNDTDSPLSSVPTNFESSPPGPSTEIDVKSIPVSAEGAARGWLHKPKQSVLTKHAFTKPLNIPIPIKVQCEFNKKSFPRSLNSLDLQDFCINIFHNGEFVLSRSYRAETVRAATTAEKQPNFAGRRLRGNTEAPFMVLPVFDGPKKYARLGGTNFVDQWNKINELLLMEADEWGRAGKYDMFRSPIGEYLEELSKLPIPGNMRKKREDGRNIGIIDVVVALGRAMVLPNSLALAEPMRRLPIALHGSARTLAVAPEEPMSELRKCLMEQLHKSPPRVVFDSVDNGDVDVVCAQHQHETTSRLSSRHQVPSRKNFMNQLSAQSDEEYHIEEIPKSGPRSRRILASQSFTTNGELSSSSQLPTISGGGHRRSRSEKMTSMTSTRSLGSSSNGATKRTRESNSNPEPSPKRQKSTLVIEVPSYTPERSSDAITPEKNSGTKQDVQRSPRPTRQRTRKTHFDEMSPTPSTSSRVRSTKRHQTPTSSSAPNESRASRTRSPAETTEKSSSPAMSTRNSYNARMFFGMDGNCDEPFEFDFGLDGSSSKRSRPSSSFTGKSTKNAAPETPDSVGSMVNSPSTSSNPTINSATQMRNDSRTISSQGQGRRRDQSSTTKKSQADESSSLPLLLPTENKPRQNKLAIGRAELKGLLGSHSPRVKKHPAFGSSFIDSTISRPSKTGKENDQSTVAPSRPAPKGVPVSRLTTYLQQGRFMIVKGLASTDWERIDKDLVTKPRSTQREISTSNNTLENKATFAGEGLADSEPTSITEKKVRKDQKKLHSNLLQASMNANGTVTGTRAVSTTPSTTNSLTDSEGIAEIMPPPKGSSIPAKKLRKDLKKLHGNLLQASMNASSVYSRRRVASSTTPVTDSHQTGKGSLQNAVSTTHRPQNHASEDTDDETSPTTNANNELTMNLRNPRRSVRAGPRATPVPSSSNMDQKVELATTRRNVVETPILPPVTIARRRALPKAPTSFTNSELEQTSNATLKNATSGNETSVPSARRKPNLVIQTGKAKLSTQSDMSSPLTNRSYVQSKEGRKAPTPKSGTFPDLKKTPTTANLREDGFFHSFDPPTQTLTQISRQRELMRARASSDAEMLLPPPTPSLVDMTPEENNVVTRSLRSRPSDLSSPTPAMGPPQRTMSSSKASPEYPWPSTLNQGGTTKKDLTTPPILPPPKPYTTRISEASHSLRSGKVVNNDPDSSRSSTTNNSADISTARTLRHPRPVPTPTSASSNPGQTRPPRPRPTPSTPMPLLPPVVPAVPPPRPWSPNDICKDSVLSFATKEQISKWFRLTYDEKQDHVVRPTRGEREGVFRAQSILMGVRYVLGADFEGPTKIDVKGQGKEVEINWDDAIEPKGKGKEREVDVNMFR